MIDMTEGEAEYLKYRFKQYLGSVSRAIQNKRLKEQKMGISLYCRYYPNKCNDAEILPFLSVDTDMDWNGKHLSVSFYDNCRELATYNEDVACYIFDDVNKLFEFAGRTETPSNMSDYITGNYQEDWIFIIWVR